MALDTCNSKNINYTNNNIFPAFGAFPSFLEIPDSIRKCEKTNAIAEKVERMCVKNNRFYPFVEKR